MKGFRCLRWTLPLLAISLLALNGCTGFVMGEITAANSAPVPPERLYPGPQPAAQEPSGQLVVLRDYNVAADACLTQIHIDGVQRADLYTANRATFRLAPGVHTLAMALGGKLCMTSLAIGPTTLNETVVVEAGRETVYILRDMPLRLDRLQ